MSDELNNQAAPRILIAEDEAIVAEDLALTLQDLGYQVVGTASTGPLAIQLAEELKPDLVLMDIRLRGEIDGIQASEQIRARFDIPVIFLTAYAETDVLSRAKVTEPYGFLAKPFSYHMLKIAIETALYKHAADKRVKESEERYRMLVEQSIDGIALIQGGILRFGNFGLARMFGFQNKEEIEGQSILPFLAPEYRDLMEKMGAEREEGKSVPDCYEFTALRKDGTPFKAEVRVNLTTYHGKKARQGIIRDISERKRMEEMLRRSQEMLSLALEGANLGIWDWDLTTGKAIWSGRINRMLGYAPDEFEPNLKNWKKLVHPDDWPRVSETLNLHLKGRIPKFEVQYRSRTKSGEWQWLQAQGTVSEFDSDGKPIRMTGVVADVSDRKKAEEALKASEQKYRVLSENIPCVVYAARPDEHSTTVFMSGRIQELTGYSVGGFLEDPELYRRIVHPDDRARLWEKIEEHRRQKSVLDVEYRIVTGTGAVKWIRDRANPTLDENGDITSIAGFMEDITERKRAEQELVTERNFSTFILDSLPGTFYLFDAQGRIIRWNTFLERASGYSSEEIGSMHVLDFFPEDEKAKLQEAVHEVFTEGETYVEAEWLTRGGERIPYYFSARKIHVEDQPCLIGVGIDITDRKRAEEELQESEQKYRSLVENIPDVTWTTDSEGNTTFISPNVERIWGYTAEEIYQGGHSLLFGRIHPDDRQDVESAAAALYEKGERLDIEYRIQRKDGRWIWLHDRSVATYDKHGVLFADGVFTDITNRKKAEEALRESEESYRILAENSLTGIFVHQDGKLVYINRRAAEGMGYSENELIGKSVWELLAPEDREMAKGRVAARLQGKQTPFQYQYRVLTRNGEIRWLEARATDIEHNGRPATLASVVDITDRKHAEEALRQSEERYRALYEDNPSMYFTMDAEGTVLSVNRFGASELGYSAEELVGQPVLMVFHEDDREAVRQQFAACLQNPMQVAHWEFRKVRKDGSVLWVKEVARSIRGVDGNPVVLVVCEDITERKQAEEALRVERERFQMLSERAPFGMLMIAEDGTFEYVNPKFTEIFGYDLSDVPNGRAWLRKAYPDPTYRHEAISAWIDDLRKSAPGETRPRIFSVTCRDGTEKIIHFRPVKLGTGSNLMTLEDITDRRRAEEAVRRAHDELEDRVKESTSELRKANEQLKLEIAERKEAEDALRSSEEKYRLLVDKAPIGIVSVDTEGRILEINQKLVDMLGSPSADATRAINVLSFELLVAAGVSDVVKSCLEQGTVQGAEMPYTSKWGKKVYLRMLATPLFNESGNVMGCQAVMEDVSDRKKAEEALRKSEERLELALKGADLGLWDYDLKTGEAFVNERRAEMVGHSVDELGHHISSWGKLVHPDDIDRVTNAFNAHVQGGTSLYESEHRLRHKSGEYKWVLARGKVVERDEQGCPARLVGTSLDITDRKRAEEALQSARSELERRVEERTAELKASEEKYRLIFERSPIGVFHFDEAGSITACNENFVRIIGSSREKLIGLNTIRDLRDKKIVAAIQEALSGGMGHYEDYYSSVTAAKTTPVKCEFAPICSDDGRVAGGIGIIEDITDRKKGEQALRESEAKYRALFEQSMDAVYMTTREGILVDANQAFLDLFGLSSEEARSMDILKIYPDPSERRRFQEEIERKGSLKDYEIRFRKNDGTKIEGLLTSTVRRDKDGTVLGYHGIVRDVTGLKQIQRQLLQAQKMEAVGTLAGGIAHDFNNLLQAILGYTDLLLARTKKTDPNHNKLEIVRQAARDGGDLVSRLLAVSMKAEFNARPTHLNEEILKVEKLLRRTIPRMIVIDLVLADDLWIIDSDSAQVEQVLLNLAVNAQHAMPDGGRLLIDTSNVSLGSEYMRSHLEVKPGNYVLLTVSDTGTGMESEVVDRIFEPFFTTKASGEGTGLGLAMVHGIVSQHGGYIRCYSEPGLGTSFKIYFPVSQTERLLDMPETRQMPAFGTETILLVDDDNRIRDVAQAIIEMGGYQVITAISGEEALEVYTARRDEVSLIILDLIMPGMGGKKCLEELLRIDPDLKVLFASGYSSNGLNFNETGTGARGFVRKPYDGKEILTAIRKVLDRGYL